MYCYRHIERGLYLSERVALNAFYSQFNRSRLCNTSWTAATPEILRFLAPWLASGAEISDSGPREGRWTVFPMVPKPRLFPTIANADHGKQRSGRLNGLALLRSVRLFPARRHCNELGSIEVQRGLVRCVVAARSSNRHDKSRLDTLAAVCPSATSVVCSEKKKRIKTSSIAHQSDVIEPR